jgi:hypothetical protein
MLQCVDAEIGEFGDFLAGRPYAEDSASILGTAVLRVEVVSQTTVSARHSLILRVEDYRNPIERDRTVRVE